jgi:multicomponent Na+:H+ antiporter subunit C
MEILLAIMIGILYASGIFMMLRRSLVKLLIGLILLGNGANLLIFVVSGIVKGKPPIIPTTADVITGAYADPLPQAVILTAIVISFGLQAFAIVLLKRAWAVIQTDNLDQMNTTDQPL